MALASAASANEIRVSRQTVRVGDPIEITIVLEGSFASIDRVPLRASNLRIEGSPSTASEFRFVNGRFSRRKIFTYLAVANNAGAAAVGPIRVVSSDGKTDTLPQIAIEVLPPSAVAPHQPVVPPGTPSPSGEAVFITTEADRQTVYVGEQAIVSWVLYSDPGVVRGFRIRQQPALEAFWVEEIPLTDERPLEVNLGGRVLQKSVLRRAALFPLRSGALSIGPLDVDVQAIERMRDPFGRFSPFNQAYTDVRRRSAPSTITAVPTGVDADAVGAFTMKCMPPKAIANGPATIDVVIDGRGSLRSSQAPRFAAPPNAAVEIQEGGVVVGRGPYDLRMRRSWKFLLFPRGEGTLEVPPIEFTAFDPAQHAAVPHACGGWKVDVRTVRESARPAPAPPMEKTPNRSLKAPLAIAGLAAVVGVVVWAMRRRTPLPPVAEAMLAHAHEPAELKRRLAESVLARGLTPEALFAEPSERGERFRALHSLIDLMEKEPWTIEESQEELRGRVGEFFEC